jgi:hypothetical protein
MFKSVNSFATLIFVSAALFVSSLNAQDKTLADEESRSQNADFVVRGQTPKEIERVLEEQFDRQRSSAGRPQLARFSNNVCPQVLGIPGTYKFFLEDRIRANAESIGLVGEKGDCEPNVMAIITASPLELINALDSKYRRSQGYFRSLYNADVEALKNNPGPTWAWQMLDIGVLPGSLEYDQVRQSPGASRISREIPKYFERSFVIIDVDKLDGVQWTQLADFITVRSLANIRQRATENNARETILTLFSDRVTGHDPQATITPSDRAMLTALYNSRSDLMAERQIDAMARTIVKNAAPLMGPSSDSE